MSGALETLSGQVRTFLTEIVPQSPNVPALKAAKEGAEFAENPCLEEAADVLICLLGWAELNNLSANDIVETAMAKMDVNFSRTWQREPDGTWQHV